jgi:hypothetical protein
MVVSSAQRQKNKGNSGSPREIYLYACHLSFPSALPSCGRKGCFLMLTGSKTHLLRLKAALFPCSLFGLWHPVPNDGGSERNFSPPMIIGGLCQSPEIFYKDELEDGQLSARQSGRNAPSIVLY